MKLAAVAVLTAGVVFGVQADDVLLSTYTGSAGLNDLAKASGKYMGTSTNYIYSSAEGKDPYYMAELQNTKDWSMITPATMMKPSFLQPQHGKYAFDQADKFVSWAKSVGIKVRCHTLVWFGSSPGWLTNNNWDNATMLAAMTDHITKVMTHFGDDCYAWDVVNEVLDGGGYRDTFWYKKCGASHVTHAFKVANDVKKKLGLKTKLYLNDHSMEWGGTKANFAQKVVKDMLAQGIQVDGVGLQGHLGVGGTPSKAGLMNVFKLYTDLGLDVALTEFDIRTKSPPSVATQKQQVVDYQNAIGACRDTSKCAGITVWDFSDQYSWIPEYMNPNEGWALPFYQPGGKGTKLIRKAAYDGIVKGWGGKA